MTLAPLLILAICAVSAYLIGAIPFGLFLGWLRGLDIRNQGSGNIGATNVTRVLGKAWGYPCFALDFLKGCLPVLAAAHWGAPALPAAWAAWAAVLAAGGAVAGHIWPVYLGFKGGKGVSTTLGALLPVAFWPVLIMSAVWGIVFFWGRYVSLASITAATVLPLAALGLRLGGWRPYNWPEIGLLGALAILIIAKHHGNIRRLLNGSEHRFGGRPPATPGENSPGTP